MKRTVEDLLAEWHRAVAEKDIDAVGKLLANDVSLGAPPYWPKFHGREVVQFLLGLILGTILDFTYRREWQQADELALEFNGHVGDLELQGIDLITLNEDFRVQNLDVLIRPTNAVDRLRDTIAPEMTAFLGRQAKGPA